MATFQPFMLERLLNALSMVLCGQSYREPGSPDRLSVTQLTSTIREIQVGLGLLFPPHWQSSEQKDIDTFTVALNTLGSFDFTGALKSQS
jgi:FKBP12-rapamycin complex-associated protein